MGTTPRLPGLGAVLVIGMNEGNLKRPAVSAERPAPRLEPRETANPGELARRELIEWCERHGLPVPIERRRAHH